MTLPNYSLQGETGPETVEYDYDELKALINNMEEHDALTAYSLLGARLNLGATKIDMLEELDMQFRAAKTLQAEAGNNRSENGMKDRTQTLGSVTTLLKAIADVRSEVLSQERLKRIEKAIRATLKAAPAEMREVYVDLYGEFLQNDVKEELKNGPPEGR